MLGNEGLMIQCAFSCIMDSGCSVRPYSWIIAFFRIVYDTVNSLGYLQKMLFNHPSQHRDISFFQSFYYLLMLFEKLVYKLFDFANFATELYVPIPK